MMLSSFRRHLRSKGIGFGQLVSDTVQYVLNEHEILTRASAIAFDALLAFVPVITLAANIAAHLLPSLADSTGQATGVVNVTAQEVMTLIRSIFPPAAATIIHDQIVFMQSQPPLVVITIIALLSLWFGSGLFAEIINAINHIYGVTESRPFLRVRLTTLVMIAVQSAILLLSLGTIIAWPWILEVLGLHGSSAFVATAINWVVVFLMILTSYTLTFKLGPSVSREVKWVSPGAICGTILFLIATYLFRQYAQHIAHYQTLYGPLGLFFMMMVWLWLMSLVFLMATEMNKLAKFAAENQ